MIEENPYLSEKEIAQALSLHHGNAKGLITEELNLSGSTSNRFLTPYCQSTNCRWSKILRKLSGNSMNFKSKILSVYFENSRSTIWAGADLRRPTRPMKPIGVKKITFWVCFTLTGIVDIVMLPLEEMSDRSFFLDAVLDSLKKSSPKFPIRIQKRATFAFG
jgi:hypothetical protein